MISGFSSPTNKKAADLSLAAFCFDRYNSSNFTRKAMVRGVSILSNWIT